MTETPHLCYFICCTHRTGSYLLAEALENTGLAGRPGEHLQSLIEPWDPGFELEDYRAALQPLLDRGTVNGIFATKMMWAWFGDTITKLQHLADRNGITVGDLIAQLFPNIHYIMLTRRDKVRQMISLARAAWTNEWRSTQTQGRKGRLEDLKIDPAAVDSEMRGVRFMEASFQKFFVQHDIHPFRIVYEQLAVSYEETALAVLDFLGIEHPATIDFGPRRLEKQWDAASDELLKKYYAAKGISPIGS